MKKNSIILAMAMGLISTSVFSQVGVHTANPQATFHIDGAKDNAATGVPASAQQANDVVVTRSGNVGIGTTVPNSSAVLDVNVNNLPANNKKGILFPQVSLTGRADITTVPSPANGLIVYNTVNAGSNPDNVIKDTFYIYNSTLTKWVRLIDENSLPSKSASIANILGFLPSGNNTTFLGPDLGSKIRIIKFDKVLVQGDIATYNVSTNEFTANKSGYYNFQISLTVTGTIEAMRVGISKPFTGAFREQGNASFAFFKDEDKITSPTGFALLNTSNCFGSMFMNAGEKVVFLTRFIDPSTNTINVESSNYNRTLINTVTITYFAP
ncbi:hypothetical protein ODZ84_00435 [Chryseobacterium fluminis]|uniref:hypothetical protein n=1 Tax=Chryseobacterium fluminis TaxID=2983606 RepID=UPI0022509C25|nr:hypothetical protein [Chryseobacterium sp. MMS21-Ot14]UZT98071.1 hypothetical protein ODZ84_00435 [Chryseobacterium sp. MMS21-Ot14]